MFFVPRSARSGGDLRRLELKRHRDTEETAELRALRSASRSHLCGAGRSLGDLPNHRTQYSAQATQYKLADGAATLEVRLEAPPVNGVKVTKTYRFHRGSYVIDVAFDIANQGPGRDPALWLFPAAARRQGARRRIAHAADLHRRRASTPAKKNSRKLTFSDIEKGKASYPKTSDDGWIAMLQHYFLGAWLPKNGTPREFYTRKVEGLYAAGVIVRAPGVQPGGSATLDVPLYAGPQEQDKLAKLAPGLDLSVDYGWLTIIAVPLFWVLSWLYQLGRQLGCRDHPAHGDHQAHFLSAVRGELSLDGEDARPRAEAAAAERAVWRRQAAHAAGDDGALQDREDQSARRLPADRRADSGVHRALLGAAGERRAAARAVHAVDPRSVARRSFVVRMPCRSSWARR